ncbi:MAG: hypothetical protein ACPGF7_10675 [Pontibacterium sp.]
MPYIGTQPLTGQFKKLDAITVVNGQAAYTMNYNSAAYKPATANALLVSVNGVIQAAGDAYTINGSTITFTENLVTGDVIDFIIALGDTGSAVTPVDGSVTTAKLANNAITRAKLADDLSGTNLAIDTTSSTFKMTDLSSNAFYRKGTWTPLLTSSGATDGTASIYSGTPQKQSGEYTRIGDTVNVTGRVHLSSSTISYTNGGADNQRLIMHGLPFTISNSDTNYFPSGSVGYFATWTGWLASYTPMALGYPNTKGINFYYADADGVTELHTQYLKRSGADIIVSLTYRTDDA